MSIEKLPWFALNIRTRYGDFVDRSLKGKGYESFNPVVSSTGAPLYPGYLFCRLNIENRLSVLVTSGVLDVVRVAGRPAVVSDEEVESVRGLIESSLPIRAHPWAARDGVRIKTGPCRGMVGVVERLKGQNRLVCIFSVDAIQQSRAVEIDIGDAEPITR